MKLCLSFRKLGCHCFRETVTRESLTNREMDVDGKSIDQAAAEIERRMVEVALKKYHWNKQHATQELGLEPPGVE
jgi:DNA-binding NtrC family response regulator